MRGKRPSEPGRLTLQALQDRRVSGSCLPSAGEKGEGPHLPPLLRFPATSVGCEALLSSPRSPAWVLEPGVRARHLVFIGCSAMTYCMVLGKLLPLSAPPRPRGYTRPETLNSRCSGEHEERSTNP